MPQRTEREAEEEEAENLDETEKALLREMCNVRALQEHGFQFSFSAIDVHCVRKQRGPKQERRQEGGSTFQPLCFHLQFSSADNGKILLFFSSGGVEKA